MWSRASLAFTIVAGLLLVAGAGAAQMSREQMVRYGAHLAQECVSCHRRDGHDVGIPGIVKMTEQEFIDAMMLYKTGRRKNKVMVSVTGSLDTAQIQALAVYFTTQGKP